MPGPVARGDNPAPPCRIDPVKGGQRCRTQFDEPFYAGFMNAAFVWNPILGRTMNYSTFGAGAAVLAGGYPVATLTVR